MIKEGRKRKGEHKRERESDWFGWKGERGKRESRCEINCVGRKLVERERMKEREGVGQSEKEGGPLRKIKKGKRKKKGEKRETVGKEDEGKRRKKKEERREIEKEEMDEKRK